MYILLFYLYLYNHICTYIHITVQRYTCDIYSLVLVLFRISFTKLKQHTYLFRIWHIVFCTTARAVRSFWYGMFCICLCICCTREHMMMHLKKLYIKPEFKTCDRNGENTNILTCCCREQIIFFAYHIYLII